MIILKGIKDKAALKESGRIVGMVLEKIEKEIEEGLTGLDLNTLAEELILTNGGIPAFKNYRGFPSCICVSINEEAVHGIPNGSVFKKNDLVSVDVGVLKDGFYGDAAITVMVGKKKDSNLLLTTTKKCLYNAIALCKPGNRMGDVEHIIEETAKNQGFTTIRNYGGHGVGRNLHEKPFVHNYGKKGTGVLLKPGVVIAIEPILSSGRNETKLKTDGWTVITKDGSLTAHFEHTIMVTEDDAIVLTSYE